MAASGLESCTFSASQSFYLRSSCLPRSGINSDYQLTSRNKHSFPGQPDLAGIGWRRRGVLKTSKDKPLDLRPDCINNRIYGNPFSPRAVLSCPELYQPTYNDDRKYDDKIPI
jgi:hypothetical protein